MVEICYANGTHGQIKSIILRWRKYFSYHCYLLYFLVEFTTFRLHELHKMTNLIFYFLYKLVICAKYTRVIWSFYFVSSPSCFFGRKDKEIVQPRIYAFYRFKTSNSYTNLIEKNEFKTLTKVYFYIWIVIIISGTGNTIGCTCDPPIF